MSKHHNFPNNFPEFRCEQLQWRAKSWVDKYPAINFKKISLYRFGWGKTKLQRLLSDRLPYFPNYIKYVLVFEFSNNIDLPKLDTYPKSDDDECIRSLKEIKFVDQQVDRETNALFDSSFKEEVYRYRKTPVRNYYREWMPVLKKSGEELNKELNGFIRDDVDYWILYSQKYNTNSLPQEVIALIKRAQPEIKPLEEQIRKVRQRREEVGKNKRQNEIFRFCRESENKLKFVKEEYFKDWEENFKFNIRPTRGIIGRLLQKIVVDHGYEKYSYQALWCVYKSLS